MTHAALMDAIHSSGAGKVLRSAFLFDVYRAKPGAASNALASDEKSLAVRLQLSADDATLTEEEIEAAVKAVLAQLTLRLGARLRG